MVAAKGNTAMELAWKNLERISQDPDERKSAEADEKILGEQKAQYHAGFEDGYAKGYAKELRRNNLHKVSKKWSGRLGLFCDTI